MNSGLPRIRLARSPSGDVAMTCEATLRGLILPVGGIKEKVLAAHRAGIKTIIMPERNKKDLIDVPEQAKKEMTFVFAHSMVDVLKTALESDPFAVIKPEGSPGTGGGDVDKPPEGVPGADGKVPEVRA